MMGQGEDACRLSAPPGRERLRAVSGEAWCCGEDVLWLVLGGCAGSCSLVLTRSAVIETVPRDRQSGEGPGGIPSEATTNLRTWSGGMTSSRPPKLETIDIIP